MARILSPSNGASKLSAPSNPLLTTFSVQKELFKKIINTSEMKHKRKMSGWMGLRTALLSVSVSVLFIPCTLYPSRIRRWLPF